MKDAGKVIADEQQGAEALTVATAIVDNWRSAHSFPLNTVQTSMRRLVRQIDPEVHLVQRLKRLPSIRSKLIREQPQMQLTMINDIGGCRAVMASIDDVDALKAKVLGSRLESELRKTYDYVQRPKLDGYRSIHFAYTYQGRRTTAWNGLRIEVQIRSQLQHAWSTAVEVVALFTGQRLKWGLGDANWQRFFVLASSAIARREGRTLVPGTPSDWKEARSELRRLATNLDVDGRLSAYSVLPNFVEEGIAKGGHYHLLRLDLADRTLRITSFKRSESQRAAIEYGALEHLTVLDPYTDIVLVAADSLADLKRSYPNYFADTDEFRRIIREETR